MTRPYPLIALLFFLPWLATLCGSMLGLQLRLGSQRRQGALLGFAAGVMLASCVWSLILPAFQAGGPPLRAGLLATLGFLLGCAGMLGLDRVTPHQHMDDSPPEGRPSHLPRPMLLVMAVALHNIPEGLALGVLITALQTGGASPAAAAAFGLGLALQNFPEGLAVVLPMRQAGVPQRRCRNLGALASFAEPAAALLGWGASALLSRAGPFILPVLLSFAAGAMVFIVVEELIPESQSGGGHAATYGLLAGFWLMALLGLLGG